jgi:hypothetical protein
MPLVEMKDDPAYSEEATKELEDEVVAIEQERPEDLTAFEKSSEVVVLTVD